LEPLGPVEPLEPLEPYQRGSDPLEKALESLTWSTGEVVLCLDNPWPPETPESPSRRVELFSLRLMLSVDRELLKLAWFISPFSVNGRLLV
jgi:hypothetical protein